MFQTSLDLGNDGKSEASLTKNDNFQGRLHITVDCLRNPIRTRNADHTMQRFPNKKKVYWARLRSTGHAGGGLSDLLSLSKTCSRKCQSIICHLKIEPVYIDP